MHNCTGAEFQAFLQCESEAGSSHWLSDSSPPNLQPSKIQTPSSYKHNLAILIKNILDPHIFFDLFKKTLCLCLERIFSQRLYMKPLILVKLKSSRGRLSGSEG